MAKEYTLDKLKTDYKKIQDKYNLPSFEKLNEDFQIEKALEDETEHLIREIRKFMAEKLSNYLRFVDTLLHPINVPMFVFSIVKSISSEEKSKLTEIYKVLIKNEVNLIELDLEFNEEKEAEFINSSYKMWQDIKVVLLGVFEKVKKNWGNKSEENNKDYFG